MKLIGFDLETARPAYDFSYKNSGISCAGFAHSDAGYKALYSEGEMSGLNAGMIVDLLLSRVANGYKIVTVNGAGFDFKLLAYESRMMEKCRRLAYYHHVDLMMIAIHLWGWRVGLDSFAKGMNVKSKLKKVQLTDGTFITDMNGAKAPELWQNGEYDAVLTYLKQDCQTTLDVALTALSTKSLCSVSQSGKRRCKRITFLPTVEQLVSMGQPDHSHWMTDQPLNSEIASWLLQ